MPTYEPSLTPGAGKVTPLFGAFAGYPYFDEVARTHDDQAIAATELAQIQAEILNLNSIALAAAVKVYNGTGAALKEYFAVGLGTWNTTHNCWNVALANSATCVAARGFPQVEIASGATGYMLPGRVNVSANTSGAGAAGDPLYLTNAGAGIGGGNVGYAAGDCLVQPLGAARDKTTSGRVDLDAWPVENLRRKPITTNATATLTAGLFDVTYVTTASRNVGSVLTLPPATAGGRLRFNSGTAGMKIAPAAGNIYYGDLASPSYIEATVRGTLTLTSDGTDWFVETAFGGNWTLG